MLPATRFTGSVVVVYASVVLRPVMPRFVRRVEHVDAQLDVAGAAEPDVPRDGQVERALEAALHVVVAGLESDAVVQRSLERGQVELPVHVAAVQPLPGIAHDADARAVVRRAGQVRRCRRRSGS